MNELLKDGSSVSVLHPRELPEGSGGAVAAGGHLEDGEDPRALAGLMLLAGPCWVSRV